MNPFITPQACRDASSLLRQSSYGSEAVIGAEATLVLAAREIERLEKTTNYQFAVDVWMLECFGAEISADVVERNHRFLEEALELVQANGCTKSEALQLVDYVFGRPIGEIGQEVGGVMVTLAALCSAAGINLNGAAAVELERVWTKVEAIRAKQAAKPKHSPLPGPTEPRMTALEVSWVADQLRIRASRKCADGYAEFDADLDRAAADLIEAEQRVEPACIRYDFDGAGWQYIDGGSGSDCAKAKGRADV